MPVVRAYTWANTRNKMNGVHYCPNVNPTMGSADAQAARVAADLAGKAVEDRGLFVFLPFGYWLDQHIKLRTVKQFLTETVDFSKTKTWYTQFFTNLRTRNLELSLVCMDEESAVSNWAIEGYLNNDKSLTSYLHSLWADPQVQAAMPANLRQFSIEQVLQHNAAAVYAFNAWTVGIRAKLLSALIRDTYVSVFGKAPVVSNYGDLRGAFTTYDNNNWQNLEVTTAGWSSPACYVAWPGIKYQPAAGRKLDPFWNCFIDCINAMRTSMAFNGQCLPWISYRSFSEKNPPALDSVKWLWNQLLYHAVATGVDRMLYWNPKGNNGATDTDDNALGEFIASVANVPRVVRQLPAIAMDTDTITTGDITTRYADYINPAGGVNLKMVAPPSASTSTGPYRTPFRTPSRILVR